MFKELFVEAKTELGKWSFVDNEWSYTSKDWNTSGTLKYNKSNRSIDVVVSVLVDDAMSVDWKNLPKGTESGQASEDYAVFQISSKDINAINKAFKEFKIPKFKEL